MLVSPRKNGLTSLFKEVRVFEVSSRPVGVGVSETLLNIRRKLVQQVVSVAMPADSRCAKEV